MAARVLAAVIVAGLFLSGGHARIALKSKSRVPGGFDLSGIPSASCGRFQQYIDHSNPSLGNFSQQFCVNSAYWAGPGSPVVLITPGEEAIDGYVDTRAGYTFLDNATLTGMYAQALGAAVVVIEHRYFGNSAPNGRLDTKALQYHTLDNAVADLANFAKNVQFSFDVNRTSNAPKAPWIYVGGSYSATLGSWIEHFAPGVFFAFHLSSAVVQVQQDNWYYFDTIRKGIDSYRKDQPGNCTDVLGKITDYVDAILASSNTTAKNELRKMFGIDPRWLQDDDFAYALSTPYGDWQQTGGYPDVLKICDLVMGSNPTKVDIKAAVQAFGDRYKTGYLYSSCTGTEDGNPLWCINTHDTTNRLFNTYSSSNSFRSWYWLLCNEPIASWTDGAPKNQLSLVSRYINVDYYQHQCQLLFPKVANYTYGIAAGRTTDAWNAKSGGWNRTKTSRIIWTNGEFDPWRPTTVSSELRPGGPLVSTPDAPVFVMKGAEHCDDFFGSKALATAGLQINPAVKEAQESAIAIVKKWIEAAKSKPGHREPWSGS